jgi:hypothetical protein
MDVSGSLGCDVAVSICIRVENMLTGKNWRDLIQACICRCLRKKDESWSVSSVPRGLLGELVGWFVAYRFF